MTTRRRYEIADTEWERLKAYFPERQDGQLGRPRSDDRQVLNGILWVVRTGAPLADLPERYGAKSTVYDRFTQWQKPVYLGRYWKSWARKRILRT